MYSSRICKLDSMGSFLVPQAVFAFISFLVPQVVFAFISTFKDLVSSDLSKKKKRKVVCQN